MALGWAFVTNRMGRDTTLFRMTAVSLGDGHKLMWQGDSVTILSGELIFSFYDCGKGIQVVQS